MALRTGRMEVPKMRKGRTSPLITALHGEAGSGLRKPAGQARVSTGMMHNFINAKRGGAR